MKNNKWRIAASIEVVLLCSVGLYFNFDYTKEDGMWGLFFIPVVAFLALYVIWKDIADDHLDGNFY